MKKLMGLFVLGFGLLVLGNVNANAAGAARGAKGSVAITNTTNVIGVSSGTAVVYAVTLSTGAVTDFVTLFDSAAATGLSAVIQTSGNYKMRLHAASATADTLIVFDPPLQFKNGIMASNATAVMSSLITFETGHVPVAY